MPANQLFRKLKYLQTVSLVREYTIKVRVRVLEKRYGSIK